MKTIESSQLQKLLKLSGMAYHSGKYTPDEWIEKTGADPRGVPGIVVTPRNQFCIWTPAAEKIVSGHFQNVKQNWAALGVPA